jgi:hypothetical protein
MRKSIWAVQQGRERVCCRVELDEDVPGHGKNYCVTCSRYFATPTALQTHSTTKAHKRRLAIPPQLSFSLPVVCC